MVGRYLATLNQAAEDAVLTGIMLPCGYGSKTERCLVGWAADLTASSSSCHTSTRREFSWLGRKFDNYFGMFNVEHAYDALCARAGTIRANNLIRSRILSNQARRALAPVREEVTCG